jgi:hypothetical protein
MNRSTVEIGLACTGLGLERLLNAWLRGPASALVPLAVGVACASVGAAMVCLAIYTARSGRRPSRSTPPP